MEMGEATNAGAKGAAYSLFPTPYSLFPTPRLPARLQIISFIRCTLFLYEIRQGAQATSEGVQKAKKGTPLPPPSSRQSQISGTSPSPILKYG